LYDNDNEEDKSDRPIFAVFLFYCPVNKTMGAEMEQSMPTWNQINN